MVAILQEPKDSLPALRKSLGRYTHHLNHFNIDNLTDDNILEMIEKLLSQYKYNHSSGSFTVHIKSGGVVGTEYIETRK